jgi:hypothetical protein
MHIFLQVLLTAMTLAVPQRTNIPRPTKKDPKDTPDHVFNKLAWGFLWDGGSIPFMLTYKSLVSVKVSVVLFDL